MPVSSDLECILTVAGLVTAAAGAALVMRGGRREERVEPQEPTLPPIPRPQRPHVPPHRKTPPHEFDGKRVVQGLDSPSGRHPRTR